MTTMLESAREVLHAREIVNELMNKCELISQKLHLQMSKLIDKKSVAIDVKTSSLKIKAQPKLLNPKYVVFYLDL